MTDETIAEIAAKVRPLLAESLGARLRKAETEAASMREMMDRILVNLDDHMGQPGEESVADVVDNLVVALTEAEDTVGASAIPPSCGSGPPRPSSVPRFLTLGAGSGTTTAEAQVEAACDLAKMISRALGDARQSQRG